MGYPVHSRRSVDAAEGIDRPRSAAVILVRRDEGKAFAPNMLASMLPTLNTPLPVAIFSFSQASDHYGQIVE